MLRIPSLEKGVGLRNLEGGSLPYSACSIIRPMRWGRVNIGSGVNEICYAKRTILSFSLHLPH